MIPVGLTLQPDAAFLDLLADVIRREADYYEVAPETLWRVSDPAEADLHENGFHRRFADLARTTGRPFVAHGVGWSLGTEAAADAGRRARWLAAVRRDQAIFRFRWYTDHLGVSAPAGLAAGLPLPLPMSAHSAAVARRALRAMQAVVADVGVENSVSYFVLGDPLDEPRFLGRVLQAPRTHLLLDLHNVYTMAQNFGFEPAEYVARLDLARVIEIHVSGGSPSDPGWLPSGRVLRLDGHDDAVPEPVWRLLEEVAPRCPNLRGVTLERMEGTVHGADDAAAVREELRRARRVLGQRGGTPVTRAGAGAGADREAAGAAGTEGAAGAAGAAGEGAPARGARLAGAQAHARYEEVVARAMTAADPVAALRDAAADPALPAALRRALRGADEDGVQMSALLVARLRFERLLRGSPEAEAWFDRDPASFSAAFRRYHAEVPPAAFFPSGEARLFRGWLAAQPPR